MAPSVLTHSDSHELQILCIRDNYGHRPVRAARRAIQAKYRTRRARGELKQPVSHTRYLCASCGFNEEWIDSPDDIAKVKKKYAR